MLRVRAERQAAPAEAVAETPPARPRWLRSGGPGSGPRVGEVGAPGPEHLPFSKEPPTSSTLITVRAPSLLETAQAVTREEGM